MDRIWNSSAVGKSFSAASTLIKPDNCEFFFQNKVKQMHASHNLMHETHKRHRSPQIPQVSPEKSANWLKESHDISWNIHKFVLIRVWWASKIICYGNWNETLKIVRKTRLILTFIAGLQHHLSFLYWMWTWTSKFLGHGKVHRVYRKKINQRAWLCLCKVSKIQLSLSSTVTQINNHKNQTYKDYMALIFYYLH